MKIKNIKLLTVIFIAMNSISVATTTLAKPPMNLTQAKFNVTDYYQSGQFEKDVSNKLQTAYHYLENRIAENNRLPAPKQLAIVFDIDDTCLSNFPAYQKEDFAHTHEIIVKSFHHANAPAIKSMLAFYNLALKNKVHLFFISGRAESYRHETITNLHHEGYFAWDTLFLAKDNETKLPAELFKTKIREDLQQQNYQIILNIGDQESDLVGGFAEKTVQIPNPLYSLPLESSRSDSRQ